MDKILVSIQMKKHLTRFTDIFKRSVNLKIQPDKREFLRKEIAYLGNLTTKDDVKPNSQNIDCILNFPITHNQKDIKSFLGLAVIYAF